MACGPPTSTPRLALASQDHSGALGAEEFKACLISLGFDIANDAQVLNHSCTPRCEKFNWFLCFFFLLYFPPLVFLSFLPSFSSVCSDFTSYPSSLCDFSHLATSTLLDYCGFPSSTLLFVHPSLLPNHSPPATAHLSSPPVFRLSVADLVEEIRNHGC